MTAQALSGHVLGLYNHVLQNPRKVDAIVELSRALAQSGTHRPAEAGSADVASSGGPSSLSTLLCPLHLVGAGFNIPKIGVVGRPAGGVDVLGTVPGYRSRLSATEFDHVLSTAKYAQAIADETWAPADAALFRLRQERGTQAVPALAVASLLAKKLAAGVVVAGLEARVAAHGNFGTTPSEARRSAELYCEVAAGLGLTAVVVLTDAQVPYQPYIGRGEALSALREILRGNTIDPWLADHAKMCARISSIVASHGHPSANSGTVLTESSPSDIFEAHLKAQGSSLAQFERRVELVAQHSRTVILAEKDGYVHYDLARIRQSLSPEASPSVQSRHTPVPKPMYADDRGLRLLCPPWQEVRRGDPVIEIRSISNSQESTLYGLFDIQPAATAQPNKILEIVSI